MIAANGFAQGVIDYEANLRTLYYDLAGAHSPEVIRMLLTITTPDHLLYGSDYPYVAPQVLKQSLARMKDYLSKEPVGTNRGKAISSNCYSKYDCTHC